MIDAMSFVTQITLSSAPILTLALGLSAATCGGMAHSEPPQQPELEFTVVGAVETSGRDSTWIASTGSGEVTVGGVISTPTPCYQVNADLSAEGDSLTLALTATALPRICAQVVAAYEYQARLSHLQAGSYALKVVHAYPNTGWEGREYRLRMAVPE